MNKILNVAYHSSDLFAPILGTSIASLLVNNQEMDEINIYVIQDNISIENIKKLENLTAEYGRKIYFIAMPDIDELLGLKLIRASDRWQFFSFCRLYLDKLLPKTVHKILYLDSDVLVVDSLLELWNLDLKEYCAAGVIDCLGEKYYKALKINQNANYCNSGVLIEDLDKWRNYEIGDKVVEYVKLFNGYMYFVEQTALNGALQDNIYILHPRYNVYTIEQVLNRKERFLLRRNIRGYKEEDIQDAVRRPVIIHMTRFFLVTNRPWQENTNHPMKAEFLKYKAVTPWKDDPEFKDMRSKRERIIQKTINVLPKKIVLLVASFLYNEVRIWSLKVNLKKYGVK